MILHVGMHKTGTSSLQNSLAAALVDPHFRFIRLAGMSNGSLVLGNAYADLDEYPHDTNTPLDLRLLARRNAMIELTGQLALSDGRRPILSAELASELTSAQKEHLLDLLVRFREDLQVAAYLRRPKSYLQAAFQKRLKHFFVPLADFVQPLAYKQMFLPFDRAIGADNVSIRVFSPDCLHGQCVVEDFAHHWGVSLDTHRIEKDNRSFSMEAVKLLYIHRRRKRRFDAGDLSLLDFLGEIPGAGLRLHSSVCVRAALMTEADTDWASSRTGVQIAEDWSTEDDRAIATEDDLLKPSAATLDILAQRLDFPTSRIAGNEDEIAHALAALSRSDRRDPSLIGRGHRQMLID